MYKVVLGVVGKSQGFQGLVNDIRGSAILPLNTFKQKMA